LIRASSEKLDNPRRTRPAGQPDPSSFCPNHLNRIPAYTKITILISLVSMATCAVERTH